MKKYLAVLLACLLLAACGKPQVTTPGGYYSGPSEEEPAEAAADAEPETEPAADAE